MVHRFQRGMAAARAHADRRAPPRAAKEGARARAWAWAWAWAWALASCGGAAEAVRADGERQAADTRLCDHAGDGAACFRLGERELHGPGPDGGVWTSGRAMARFARGCDLGFADACLRLDHVQLTPARARWIAHPYAVRACERGQSAGCLAALRSQRRITPRDLLTLAKRACFLDSTLCPEAVERMLPIDRYEAMLLAERPCAMAMVEPCERTADLPLPEDALDHMQRRACELGSMGACHKLSTRWRRTRPREAEQLLRFACTRGNDAACGDLRR